MRRAPTRSLPPRPAPLTHLLRIVRAILLKGAGPLEAMPQVWPILAFTVVVGAVALTRYRQTLD